MRAQLHDAPLDLVGSALGQLEQAVALDLGLLDDRLAFSPRALADVLGGLLCGEQVFLRIASRSRCSLTICSSWRICRPSSSFSRCSARPLRRAWRGRCEPPRIEATETALERLPLDVHRGDLHDILLDWHCVRLGAQHLPYSQIIGTIP